MLLAWPLALLAQEAPHGLRVDLLEYADSMMASGQQARVSCSPRYSWLCGRGLSAGRQAGWQVLVASSPARLAPGYADMWDSGLRWGSLSAADYQGKPLRPSSTYYWTVRVTDARGRKSPWAKPRRFLTQQAADTLLPAYPLTADTCSPVKRIARGNELFVDFGCDAFGTLCIHFAETPVKAESFTVRLGEKCKGDRVDSLPGGSIRFASYTLTTQPGQRSYTLVLRKDARNTTTKENDSGMLPILMPRYVGEVMPFRYAEIRGVRPSIVSVSRTEVHEPFDDAASSFVSSDSVLNAVWQLCKHTMKATSFCGYYVDGDRERIPYEADAYINLLSHYAVDKEYSMARRTIEHFVYHPTWPTEWILLTPVLAWNDYLYTGDDRLIRRYYKGLSYKTLSALADSTQLISTLTGRMTQKVKDAVHYRGKRIRDIVDWPQSGAAGLEKENAGETDGFVFCRYNAVVNAYYYGSLDAMEKIALALGRRGDARHYARMKADVGRAFYNRFFDPSRKIFLDGDTTSHASLHANMFALAFGLVKKADCRSVAAFCESRGMACSVYGAQFLLDALYENGLGEYAYTLLTSTRKRSWWNMLRMGSTITTEAWDGIYKPNLDWNHAWGAAAGNLIVRRLLGVRPLSPGCSSIIIQPQPGSVREATAKVPTMNGCVGVHFKNPAQGAFLLELDVPANMRASVILPGSKKRLTVGPGHHSLHTN